MHYGLRWLSTHDLTTTEGQVSLAVTQGVLGAVLGALNTQRRADALRQFVTKNGRYPTGASASELLKPLGEYLSGDLPPELVQRLQWNTNPSGREVVKGDTPMDRVAFYAPSATGDTVLVVLANGKVVLVTPREWESKYARQVKRPSARKA